ncbi:MAG: ThiF family adenylyltransferase [Thaumarchaeota archaeon]|nr:ThiF family adenylyltransferase [Nitrososphaerota archaeon]
MNKIIVEENIWEKMKDHLLSDNSEHLAFFFATTVKQDNDVTFLIRDVKLISDDDFEAEGFSMRLKLDALLSVTNEARKRNMALIEIHSHPFSTTKVWFSNTDMNGFKEFVPYILDDIQGKPYAALVLGQKSVAGLCWQTNEGKSIDKIIIHGKRMSLIVPNMQELTGKDHIYYSKFDRQVSAFGTSGQIKIKQLKVAIVGLGGIGSHIVQQLAYLGVRDFVIIDFDKVTKNNLNRLVGANIDSITKPKSEVIRNMIKVICKDDDVAIEFVNKETRDKEAIKALKKADFIFGCVDNDGARVILNEISKAYMIPFLDCATGININDKKIADIGGRAVFVKPGGPCLNCANELSVNEATHYLQTEKEQESNRREGYVGGFDVPSPSVISLNGLIASAAITEFLAYVTGFRSSKTYLAYDAMEQRLREVIITKDPNCICNALEGIGDKADIENRYAKRNLIGY